MYSFDLTKKYTLSPFDILAIYQWLDFFDLSFPMVRLKNSMALRHSSMTEEKLY